MCEVRFDNIVNFLRKQIRRMFEKPTVIVEHYNRNVNNITFDLLYLEIAEM